MTAAVKRGGDGSRPPRPGRSDDSRGRKRAAASATRRARQVRPSHPLWALLTRSVPGAPDDDVELALMFFLQQLEMLGNEGRFVWSGPLGEDRSRGLTIFEASDAAQAQDTVARFSPVLRKVWEVEVLAPWEVDLREIPR